MKLIFSVVLFVFCFRSFALDFDVTCGSNGEVLGYSFLNNTSIDSNTGKTSTPESLRRYTGLCRDLEDCYSHLKTILDFTQETSIILDHMSRVNQSKIKLISVSFLKEDQQVKEFAKLKNDLKDTLQMCQSDLLNDLDKKNNETLTILYPYNGRGNVKSSRRYSKKAIEEIVRASLAAGADPYMALAIVLLENAPTVNNYESYYTERFGLIPLDKIAAYEAMGCKIKCNTGENNNNLYDQCLALPPEKMPVVNLLNGSKKSYICASGKKVTQGTAPDFVFFDSPVSDQCCSEIVGEIDSDRDFQVYLSGKFLNKIKDRFASDLANKKDFYFALGFNLQRYNGLGYFGAGTGENMNNNCLWGINMAERPVYGLLAADLMMNSLMINPDIISAINNIAIEKKVAVKSILCEAKRGHKIKIDSRKFLEMQKDFLLNYQNRVPAHLRDKEKKRVKDCSDNGKINYGLFK